MNSFTYPLTLVTVPMETLEVILPYLSQKDLCHCALVSREWNKVLTPFLWQTITIPPSITIRLNKQADIFSKDEIQQAFNRNASFVRVLHLVLKSMYEQFLPTLDTVSLDPRVGDSRIYKTGLLSNLHTLELHHIHIQPGEKTLLEERVFALVRQNPLIKRFKISLNMDDQALVQLVTEYMPNLEDFELDMQWQGNLKEFLENLPESIRKVRMLSALHVEPEPQAQTPTMDGASAMARKVRSHRALESFIISETIEGRKEDVFVRFLQSCSSKLRVFEGIGAMWCPENKAIAQALSSLGFVWTALRKDDLPYNIPDEDTARIVTSSPLTVIELFTQHLRSMTVKALIEKCDNLTTLGIVEARADTPEGTSAFTGATIQTILSKVKNLKSLYVHSPLKAHRMIAEDILVSEWATTTLEYLVVKIDTPRVYEHTTDEDEGAVDIQRSREIQRSLLRRLGQQKHLKGLVIGGGVVSDSTGNYENQRDCLELSLEAGLDELKDLNRLELLRVHNMYHRIGVPELEWMVQNWPQINHVFGVVGPERPSDEVKDWIATHRPSWLTGGIWHSR
ncbi:hypothetical protein EMPS_09165 [Entomortierella parvispora]|uniref:F-box domain-containing protein n=1 Tax=Entomortierella parvispora TaxID=205924 RepID=A0A9P3HHN7_9FUNG|nr:hypothetical protein EMPS_09165 [Entomortierella parvispora]